MRSNGLAILLRKVPTEGSPRYTNTKGSPSANNTLTMMTR